MFKRIDRLFLCYSLCFGVSFACAGESVDATDVRYRWTPGRSYYFMRSIRSADQESPSMPLIIECISQNSEGHLMLCVRLPNRSLDLIFPTVDTSGAIQDILIRQYDPMPALYAEEEIILEHLNRIVSVIEAYDEGSWLLPRVSASSDLDSSLTTAGRVFTRKQTSPTKQGSIQFNVTPLRSNRRQSESQVRVISFDVNRGIPTTIVRKGAADLETRIDYSETMHLEESGIQDRHRSLRAAVSIDEYLISNAEAFIAHEDRRIKRTSYLVLQRVESCDKRKRVWQRMHPVFSKDSSLKMLSELFLTQSARSGCDWAIAELLSEKWAELSDEVRMRRIAVLEAFTGVNLGDNPAAWRDWFSRVKSAVPLMENSTTNVFQQYLDSEDVWVKIYALTELSRKDDIPIDEWRSILENAKRDKDTLVREAAMNHWRKLQ